MRKRTKILALVGVMLVGAFVVFMGIGGFAASDTENITVTAGIAKALQMTSGGNAAFASAAVPGGAAVTAGTSMIVSSNATWSMSVYKSRDLTNTGAPASVIPSADLTLSSSGVEGTVTDQTIGLVGSPTTVNSGSARGFERAVSITYSLTLPDDATSWALASDEGDYTATHTFTATND
jgi:hypothetical protein